MSRSAAREGAGRNRHFRELGLALALAWVAAHGLFASSCAPAIVPIQLSRLPAPSVANTGGIGAIWSPNFVTSYPCLDAVLTDSPAHPVLAWPGALPVVRSDQLVLVVAAHEGCGSSLGPRRPVIESADHQRAAMVGNVRYEPLSNEERMVADAVVLPRPGSPTAPVVVRTHGIVESQCTPRLSHFTYGEDP